jgi:hypothetical protein
LIGHACVMRHSGIGGRARLALDEAWQRLGHGLYRAPAPINGRFPYLLAVRDLASGQQLLWQPTLAASAQETTAALALLFAAQRLARAALQVIPTANRAPKHSVSAGRMHFTSNADTVNQPGFRELGHQPDAPTDGNCSPFLC